MITGRVGATLAVVPDPGFLSREGCRKGSPYAENQVLRDQGRLLPVAQYRSYHSFRVMVTSAALAMSRMRSALTEPTTGWILALWRRIQAMAIAVEVMP